MCYLVVARTDAGVQVDAPAWPRIVAGPMQRTKHMHFELCTPEGQLQSQVRRKSDGQTVWYDAKRREWGELLPPPDLLPDEPGSCN